MMQNRLFEIIYILLNQKSTTAKALAERFEVSQRTIYRDIDALSLAGIPVYTEKGKYGGISLLPDFVLNKSLLSENEQHEILSALQGLSSVKTDNTIEVLGKLSTFFKKSAIPWLEVDFSDWGWRTNDAFAAFKTAILEKRVATFDYYSTYGEKTRRRVEPIQLWFKSRAWYIRCFDLEKNDLRLFKLTRVKNPAVTDAHFAERDLLAAKPVPSEPARQRPDVTLKVKIAPEMTHRVYDEFDEEEIDKQPDGSYVVTITWPEDDWVYGWVLSFGEYIEVLAPEHIREVIREKARKIAEIYG
ncbi:MAG: YafY family transcriptional regulator [Oscillospiraceae bacterium]|jgi:predicted DNA-binding transcriptional regulator YafY|nr:YafY family transcriptional regulator [Oscillospiraceae bacterium]